MSPGSSVFCQKTKSSDGNRHIAKHTKNLPRLSSHALCHNIFFLSLLCYGLAPRIAEEHHRDWESPCTVSRNTSRRLTGATSTLTAPRLRPRATTSSARLLAITVIWRPLHLTRSTPGIWKLSG